MAGPPLREQAIGNILRNLNGHSCAWYAETYDRKNPIVQKGAIEVDSDGRQKNIDLDTGFGCGSFQKSMFMNPAFAKIMNGDLIKNERKKKILEEAWHFPALRVLNELEEIDKEEDGLEGQGRIREEDGLGEWLEPKGHMTRIFELLTHVNALELDQKHLFGPDGSVLMCERRLRHLLRRTAKDGHAHRTNTYQYNNVNYLVANLILCRATGMSLSRVLEELVMKNSKGMLELENTIVKREEHPRLDKAPVAQPYIITPQGRLLASTRDYFGDDFELAVGGGITCVRDIAKLARVHMEAIEKDKVKPFFSSGVKLEIDGVDCQSFLTGLRVPLESKAASSESVEKALHGSYYELGMKQGESVDAVIKGGTIRGYACRYCFVSRARILVVVMTNSSGIVDPSLHIIQYILQQLLRLDATVDIEGKASSILENQGRLAKTRTAGLNPHLGFQGSEIIGLPGTFVDETIAMRVIIKPSVGEGLDITFVNSFLATKCTSTLRLIRIAKDVLAIAPRSEETAVDFYIAWQDFALRIVWAGDVVRSLRQVSARASLQGTNGALKNNDWVFTKQSPGS